jgi:hypothetical protein
MGRNLGRPFLERHVHTYSKDGFVGGLQQLFLELTWLPSSKRRRGDQRHAAVPDAPQLDEIEVYGSALTGNADLARSGSSSRSAESFAAAGPGS